VILKNQELNNLTIEHLRSLMIKLSSIMIFCLFVSALSLANGTFDGKVTSVIDGNTIEVTNDEKETIRIILAGIDSPELTQEFGEEAREYLEKLVLKKEVTVQIEGKDRKGNPLGVVWVKGKLDARIELLKEGLAWTAEKDPSPELEAPRTSAREKGKGLWKKSDPTPPWIHRRKQSMLQPKGS
jgi:micrococcal nuclease